MTRKTATDPTATRRETPVNDLTTADMGDSASEEKP